MFNNVHAPLGIMLVRLYSLGDRSSYRDHSLGTAASHQRYSVGPNAAIPKDVLKRVIPSNIPSDGLNGPQPIASGRSFDSLSSFLDLRYELLEDRELRKRLPEAFENHHGINKLRKFADNFLL